MKKIESLIRSLLKELGDDPERPGLEATPSRVARMWTELIPKDQAPPKLTCFPREMGGIDCDEMVVTTDIPFVSFCEHHMLPFVGHAAVGYIPGTKIVGLSKLARAVEYFAKRLQVQERLTAQVADYLLDAGQMQGVCVMLSAEHMCMSIRGIKKPGHGTNTHAIRGDIDKLEFLRLVSISGGC